MKKPIIVIVSLSLAISLIALLVLFRQYNKTKETVISLEKKLSELDERTVQTDQENNALREKIQDNIEQLEQLRNETKHVAELENTIASLRDEIASLKDEIASSNTTAAALRQELDNVRLLNSELNDKDQKMQDEITRLGSQISDMEKQKEAVDFQLSQLKSEHESMVAGLKNEIQNRDNTIGELNEKMGVEVSNVENLKEKVSNAQADIESLMGQAAAMKKEKLQSDAYLQKTTTSYDAAISDLNQEIVNKDARILSLTKELEKIQSEADILMDKVNSSESKVKALEQKISNLFGEKALLESQMDQFRSTHRSMIAELKSQIDKKEVNIKELKDKLSITFVDRILFEFGKSAVSPQGKEILEKVGKILKTLEDKKIRVVGHTDNVPIMEDYRYKYPSNWELSASRAASVVRFFQNETGIDPKNLEAVGRSFYDPIESNDTKEGRAKNRRVAIIITPKTE